MNVKWRRSWMRNGSIDSIMAISPIDLKGL